MITINTYNMKKIVWLWVAGFALCGCQQQDVKQHLLERSLQGITVTAHTGAYDTPDNSLEFIETAIANRAEVIEFDVRFRPDGTLAMSHDSIRTNDEGVEIAQVLQLIQPTDAMINLDIKEERVLADLHSLVKNEGMMHRVFLTGIPQEKVELVKINCPGIYYFLNCTPDETRLNDGAYRDSLVNVVQGLGAVGINCHFSHADKTLAEELRSKGLLLSVWTVNKEEDMRRVIDNRPDNITSRHPDTVLRLMNKQ